MGKRMKYLLQFVVVCMVIGFVISTNVEAEQVNYVDSGNYQYQIIDNIKKEIKLIKIRNYGSKVEIPTEIDGYKVVSIGAAEDTEMMYLGFLVFAEKDTIVKELVIPEGVRNLGVFSFNGMQALEEIKLPKSLEKIQQGAFADCNNLKEVSVPKGTALGEAAFSGCNNLKTVTVRSSKFAEGVFSGSIKRMIFPDDADETMDIGMGLKDCTIDEMVISRKVKYVGFTDLILKCSVNKIYVKGADTTIDFSDKNKYSGTLNIGSIELPSDAKAITFAKRNKITYRTIYIPKIKKVTRNKTKSGYSYNWTTVKATITKHVYENDKNKWKVSSDKKKVGYKVSFAKKKTDTYKVVKSMRGNQYSFKTKGYVKVVAYV